MNQSWKQSNTAKAMLIALTITALIGTVISGICGCYGIQMHGAINDTNTAEGAYTLYIKGQHSYDLINYLSAAVKTEPKEGTWEVESSRWSSVTTHDREVALSLYEEKYLPDKTNLRFHAVDSSGKTVLANDTETNADTAEKLGSVTFIEWIVTKERIYTVQQHFDSYDALQNADMASYLEDTSHYALWYFTEDKITAANDSGLTAYTLNEPFTESRVFDSLAEAQAFDYEAAYGTGVTWEILQTESGAEGTAAADKAVVLVTAYAEYEEAFYTLEEFFELKSIGVQLTATDPELDALLQNGLDVTIKGLEYDKAPYTLTVWLPAKLPVPDEISNNYSAFRLIYGKTELFTAVFFLLGTVTVLAAVAMCSAAGHAKGTDGIVLPLFHKLPYEFFWLLPPVILSVSDFAMNTLEMATENWRIVSVFGTGLLLCLAVLAVLWLYTTAIRIKSGTFWSSFGIVRLFRSIFSLFRHRTGSCIAAAAAATVLGIFNAVAFATRSVLIIPAIGLDLLALLFILYCMYSYFTLHQHLVQIEQGDFTPRRYLIPLAGDFLRFDTELNTLTDTVSTMVAEQIKAERMRTELITNVSHDLKTPLTSIVNYVDLLSREPMQSETAGEYLDVLRRQAARLKKLTTDLVDASKASTGNIAVEMQVTNVQVLLGQFSGEYDERLRERGLELVMHMPELPVCILADGRLSWRIFDNLLNNACKYAMSGTRIYLDVNAGEQEVCISMKNVSAAPLNISPDELMERFVRGDASRHTEGSGLGLSIARDLAALQGGTLTLSVDGDLFKASLQFPRYEEPPLLPDSVV